MEHPTENGTSTMGSDVKPKSERCEDLTDKEWGDIYDRHQQRNSTNIRQSRDDLYYNDEICFVQQATPSSTYSTNTNKLDLDMHHTTQTPNIMNETPNFDDIRDIENLDFIYSGAVDTDDFVDSEYTCQFLDPDELAMSCKPCLVPTADFVDNHRHTGPETVFITIPSTAPIIDVTPVNMTAEQRTVPHEELSAFIGYFLDTGAAKSVYGLH